MKTFRQFREELVKQAGTQLGSNEGGVHVDSETGKKYYVKHYDNPDQGKVEALTGKIYQHMGINTLNPERHGESGIKTAWNEHVKTEKPSFYDNPSKKHADQIGRMYHGAILTKNWDIAGLVHDNIVHNQKTGDLHAIDHGGAFHFRAQGGPKEYGPDISEKESLRNPNNASGHIFNSAFEKHPEAEHEGLKAVRNMDDDHIHHLFKTSGLSNWKELHSNFMKRKQALIDSYK